MAVLASEKPGITMRDVFKRPHNRPHRPRLDHSPIIIGPPSSPEGFKLELTHNIPSPITPAERTMYLPKAEEAHTRLEGTPGYFNPIKVNIISAHVEIKPDSDCIPREVILYDTAPSEYKYFRTIIDDAMPYETARHLTHSGGNVVWRTGDGWLVLGSRQDVSQYYPRTLEATASGGWDGQLDPKRPELLVSPTKEDAYHHIQKETTEELNIYTSNQTHLTVLGIAEEPTKKNWDILYYGQLPPRLTRARLTQLHAEKKNNGQNDLNDPMAGHLTFIPATPGAIRRLLFRMHTPINPMAQRVLLLTGYMLRLEELRLRQIPKEKALLKAHQWKRHTEHRMNFDRWYINTRFIAPARRVKIEKRRLELIKRIAIRGLHRTPENERKVEAAFHSLRNMQATSPTYDIHLPPAKQIGKVPEVKPELERLGVLPDNKTRNLVQRWRRRRISKPFIW